MDVCLFEALQLDLKSALLILLRVGLCHDGIQVEIAMLDAQLVHLPDYL